MPGSLDSQFNILINRNLTSLLLPPLHFFIETDSKRQEQDRVFMLHISMVCLSMQSEKVDVHSVSTEVKSFPESSRNKTIKWESIGAKYRQTELFKGHREQWRRGAALFTKEKYYAVLLCVLERGNMELPRSHFGNKIKPYGEARRNEFSGGYSVKTLALWGDKKHSKDRVGLAYGLYANTRAQSTEIPVQTRLVIQCSSLSSYAQEERKDQ